MGLRLPTELVRITCSQELEIVIDAEKAAPEGTERNVQLLIPDGPVFHFTIDHPTPLEAGKNRNYKMPVVPNGQAVEFRLQPHQKVYGCVESGIGEASAIIEYLEAE